MAESIWYIVIGSISVGIAWAIRKIEPIILQFFIAIIVPGILSAVLACIPEWLNPSPPGEGAFGWTIIIAATWAMWAIPTCLVAVIVFYFLRRKKLNKPESNEERNE